MGSDGCPDNSRRNSQDLMKKLMNCSTLTNLNPTKSLLPVQEFKRFAFKETSSTDRGVILGGVRQDHRLLVIVIMPIISIF